jgi:formate hydrogenlyase transcriptional activator
MFVDITERVLMEQEQARLQAQNSYLQEEIRSEHNFGEIVGNSEALIEVLQQVDQVAPADSTALIIGETGTGKELVARAIHDRSGRKSRPLVKVNCGAISAGLAQTNWMIEGERGAAKILNLNPSTLRSRMQKLGINRPGKPA